MLIDIIIVLYFPNKFYLQTLIDNLYEKSNKIFLIDNSPKNNDLNFLDKPKVNYIFNNKNLGIAAAQNIGIKKSIDSEIIVFFDQDTYVDKNFLDTLLGSYKTNKNSILVPKCIDNITNMELPSLRLNRFGFPKRIISNSNQNNLSKIHIAISSGMIVPTKIFRKVGLFDENFFIDLVDTEFCLRCRHHKIEIFLTSKIQINHRIGKNYYSFFNLKIFNHSPKRVYFQIRNSFLIFKKKNIPFVFSFYNLISNLINRFILICISNKKSDYIKFYLKGVLDGIF